MNNRDKYYTQINSEIWDKWVEDGIEWGIPITHEEYLDAVQGKWGVYLTPRRTVPKEWFPDFKSADILGLASGGGQQMPIFAALGGRCTIFDNSAKQLESEKMTAEREGYSINIIKGDMTKPLPFENNSFDLIFHPVSNCYIEDVEHVWNECYRILKPGGILLAGCDNGMNFLVEEKNGELVLAHKLPFNPLKNPLHRAVLEKENGGMQFSHTLEEQIGGQLRAGFLLCDIYEDRDREGRLSEYTPQYFATRSVKAAE